MEKKGQTEEKRQDIEEARSSNDEVYSTGHGRAMQFYSKSKYLDAKYLSNFQMHWTKLHIDGKLYWSVEHYFQAQKVRDEDQVRFTTEGEYGNCPKMAKKQGSKGGMKKNGLKLIPEWDSVCPDGTPYRVKVMKKGLKARYEQDSRFRRIIDGPYYFVHFENCRGGRSFWGACKTKKRGWVGRNVLGLLMGEIQTGTIDPRVPRYMKVDASILLHC
ncbi:MAG: hypothetical protein CL881_03875 [Dehalococcoidia bacterium]|nr:hypothetical protein [Dehalococcoidia bacterium]